MTSIIVNGKVHQWANDTINYAEVTYLAFPEARGQFTVSFSRGSSPAFGVLLFSSDNEVVVQNGTTFTVAPLSN